jgi:hypothetical protein
VVQIATNPLYYDAIMNEFNTAISTSGLIKIYTGSQPALNAAVTGTLLATLTFSSTAFGASSAAVITASSITSGTAGNTGTAGYFAVTTSGGTVVFTGTCGTTGTDMIMNSTSIVSGANVSCSSFTITG